MHRRHFLAYGASSAVTLALPGMSPDAGVAEAQSATLTPAIDLVIEDVLQEMVDGEHIPMLAFSDRAGGPRVPGPVLRVREGDVVEVRLRNASRSVHAFEIPGAPGSTSGPIPPGQTRSFAFTAPVGGTYLYLDPTSAPLCRLLGLHGVLVVMPRNGRTSRGRSTPYSIDRMPGTPAAAALEALFNAFGTNWRFPGEPWLADDPKRECVWVFHQVDPSLNAAAASGVAIDPARIRSTFLPRYFTLNGVSGYDSAKKEENVPKGYIGQPVLIRVANAGLATHSPHIHGNHVFELSATGLNGEVVVKDNLLERDTWSLPPLARKDVLLPFEQPEDIPPAVYPPRQEPFPLRYPMHCHTEMSQTAAGGNYPQGLVTDWEILGPLQVQQAALGGGR